MGSLDNAKIYRIAILEAGDAPEQAAAKYGSFGGMFKSLLHEAAEASRIPTSQLAFTGWDVVNPEPEGEDVYMGGMYDWERRRGYPDMEEIDAILITGSRFNCFDNDPWILRLVDYTRKALEHPHLRVIGVCFGHQILGRALGSKVARHSQGEWEASVCEVQQSRKGKELFGGKDVLSICQMHEDIVVDYPPNVERLGPSTACEVQGMYVEKQLISVQGHPEFGEEIERELLEKKHRQGTFDDALFAECMGRVHLPHDGVLVAQGFLKFLME